MTMEWMYFHSLNFKQHSIESECPAAARLSGAGKPSPSRLYPSLFFPVATHPATVSSFAGMAQTVGGILTALLFRHTNPSLCLLPGYRRTFEKGLLRAAAELASRAHVTWITRKECREPFFE